MKAAQRTPHSRVAACFVACFLLSITAQASTVSIHTDFEGGSLGHVERVSETHLRCKVKGQVDQDGRNRQVPSREKRRVFIRTFRLALRDELGELFRRQERESKTEGGWFISAHRSTEESMCLIMKANFSWVLNNK